MTNENNHIATLSIGSDVITITTGKCINYEPVAIARFEGNEGWGVTMNIPPSELRIFVGSITLQKQFIAFAKDKLGLSES